MKNVLFYVSVIVASGIFIGRYCIGGIVKYDVLLLLCLILSVLSLFKERKVFCLAFIGIFYFVAGIVLYKIEYRDYYLNELYEAVYILNKIPCHTPIYVEFKLDEVLEVEKNKLSISGEVIKLVYNREPRRVRANIRLSVKINAGDYRWRQWKAGDILSSYIILMKPIYYKNNGSFNVYNYLFVNRIHLTGTVKTIYLIKKIGESNEFIFFKFCYHVKESISNLIDEYFMEGDSLSQEGGLLKAMLTGRRYDISDETNELFQKSGLYHLIAISGFNVSIIYFFIYVIVCKILFMGRRVAFIILTILLPFFIVISSASASVLRAGLMSILLMIGYLLYQNLQIVNLLGASALIILLAKPSELFDVGFQLTYLVTLSLITIGGKIYSYFPKGLSYLSMNISFSIASIIAVIPHGIILFHRIVLIAVFLNIVVVPIFSAALVLGIVFVILPIDIMRVCIAALIKSMIAAVILIAGRSVDIPIFSFNVAGSGVLFAAVVVMILIACVYIKGYKSKILLIIVLFIIILTNKVISQSYDKGVFQLIMFDVGAGESMLIKCPNGDKLIIDGGGSVYSNFDVGMKVLKQALLKIGVSRIDYAILTHEHPDHRRGLEYILREFKIKELWDSNCSNRNFACKNLMGIMKSNHILFSRLSEGNIIEVGNVKIKVLHSPLFNRSRKPNENSIVIMVEVYGRKLLLTGDIESKNEQELIKKYGKFLKADIIKVPHHGSKSSSTEEFLEQISPRIALLSVGNAEFLNLPNEEVIRRYINYRCELYRTDINGEIFVSIYPDGMIKINIFNE